MRIHHFIVIIPALALLMTSCKSGPDVTEPDPIALQPDYGRPLGAGESALRLITDPARLPDLAGAFDLHDALVLDSLEQSMRWYEAPSSKQFFPFETITHEQAKYSVIAMRDLLEASADADSFRADLLTQFDVYESVGYNGDGIVLFTGYFSPIFSASRVPSGRFNVPLYTRPDDLITDPVTGEPQGRLASDGNVVPYYTRREIEESRMFAGRELVWVEDALSAYIIHVNGSAKLRLADGEVMYIGYAGKTDKPYASLGKAMIDAGLATRGEMSLARIRQIYRENPARVEQLMYDNENYVFFTEYPPGNWPAGSLGVPVTAETSLATDKRIYPRGGVVLVDTKMTSFSQGHKPFLRFMADQDTGGAIKAPGRADIFMGIGPSAEILAGGQYAEGRLYYFFLKPEYLGQYKRGQLAGVGTGG